MPYIPSTITEQINDNLAKELSYRTLHESVIIQDITNNTSIEIPYSSLTNKYRDFLSNIIVSIELSDDAIAKYRYRPKMLSEDLYGSTEFWNDILVLNKCTSVVEFNPKILSVYDPEKFKQYLNEIMIQEKLV